MCYSILPSHISAQELLGENFKPFVSFSREEEEGKEQHVCWTCMKGFDKSSNARRHFATHDVPSDAMDAVAITSNAVRALCDIMFVHGWQINQAANSLGQFKPPIQPQTDWGELEGILQTVIMFASQADHFLQPLSRAGLTAGLPDSLIKNQLSPATVAGWSSLDVALSKLLCLLVLQETTCMNHWAAGLKAVGHTLHECPLPRDQNMRTARQMWEGQPKTFYNIKNQARFPRSSQPICWFCYMPLSFHEKPKQCLFADKVAPLCYMLFVFQREAMTQCPHLPEVRTSTTFQQYWSMLKEVDPDGTFKIYKYVAWAVCKFAPVALDLRTNQRV
ncbi:hypothetical protein AURDEDRAFT_131449 [Auricularia subglabra TFB-10046 SS5]|uniref:C2H2-type domain-containing protein n=1 Tax=Auricularia subglabra (strain TFB-10046 / SS5) TaxID=717982 RepID=J0CU77_AURST|nr:hypothetical protein AURDEDRAFT_131449 [Auricularia subglabra TFB-10046 SS5]